MADEYERTKISNYTRGEAGQKEVMLEIKKIEPTSQLSRLSSRS